MAGYLDDDLLPPSASDEGEVASSDDEGEVGRQRVRRGRGARARDEVAAVGSEADSSGPAPEYGSSEWWERLYAGEFSRDLAPEEWLLSWEHFTAQRWQRFLPKPAPDGPPPKLLDCGCGDAKFMQAAYDEGWKDITCIDIVGSVVERMRSSNTTRPGLKFAAMDARDMSLEDGSFDLVFDKSTFDALKCDSKESVRRYSREVHRVLKDDGKWLCVTLHVPEVAVKLVKDTGDPTRQWKVRSFVCEHEFHEDEYTYLLVCTKDVAAESTGGAGGACGGTTESSGKGD